MPESSTSFSRWFGYRAETPREIVPLGFRVAVREVAEAGLGLHLAEEVLRIELELPARHAAYHYTFGEHELERCKWWQVFDVAEAYYDAFHKKRASREWVSQWTTHFEKFLNDRSDHYGMAWRIVNGRFEFRRDPVASAMFERAETTIRTAGKTTSADELHQAFQDLSRRPQPDVTGAIQHAGAAIECLARDLCGDPTLTLGEIIRRYPAHFPGAYKKRAEAVWGISSNEGRHLSEGGVPTFDQAMFLVGVVAPLCDYLLRSTAQRL